LAGYALNDCPHGLDIPQRVLREESVYFVHLRKEGANGLVEILLIDNRLLNISYIVSLYDIWNPDLGHKREDLPSRLCIRVDLDIYEFIVTIKQH